MNRAHAGDTHHLLSRYLEPPIRHRAHTVALCQAVEQTGQPLPQSKLPGDPRSMRGIPIIARGVEGASPGTKP